MALPLVSMGNNSAATDANTEITMNVLIVPIVVYGSNVCNTKIIDNTHELHTYIHNLFTKSYTLIIIM